MKSVRLNIEGLEDIETQNRVKNQLKSLNGVKEVNFSVDEKYVDVTYDRDVTSAHINNHLQNNGYKVNDLVKTELSDSFKNNNSALEDRL